MKMTAKEREFYSPANLALLSYDEVLDIRRGLLARQKLQDLGVSETELSEVELQDGLDRYLGLKPEREAADRSFTTSDEGDLQRAFDTYLGLR